MARPRLTPEAIYTRKQVAKLMACSDQGGIVISTKTNSIMIYTDDETGKKFGYVDGWLAEDEDGPLFEYTGAGDRGDQTFDGRLGSRNRALLEHASAGRTLHLFTAVGKVPGSNTKRHRHVGEMTLDTTLPYYVRQSRDLDDNQRKVIVFRMRAADGRPPKPQDMIPPAPSTSAELVPADVTASSIVPTEKTKKRSSSRAGSAPTTSKRREAELTDHCEAFLTKQGHDFGRFQIKVKGTTTTLVTDIYDATAHVLYEAKGSSSRKHVREAIGQIMDYRRHVTPPNPTAAILLPTRPHDDLQDLIASAGIALVYRDGDNYVGYPARPPSAGGI